MTLYRVLLAVLLSAATSPSFSSIIIDTGPIENVAVFWLDPSRPNANTPPSFQAWGQTFTAVDSQLDSLEADVRLDASPTGDDATFFQLTIKLWSDLLKQPTSDLLYQSSLITASDIVTYGPDCGSPFGCATARFSTNLSVTPGETYVALFAADGIAGLALTSGFEGGALQEYSDKSAWCDYCVTGWSEFTGQDVVAAFEFSSSEVPTPSVLLLLGLGLVGVTRRRTA